MPLFIVTLGRWMPNSSSSMPIQTKKYISPNARERLDPTGGMISNGIWPTCKKWKAYADNVSNCFPANRLVGATRYNARTVLFWNLIAHADGSPKLPGTNSCEPGCRPVVAVDNNQWYLNQECEQGTIVTWDKLLT